METDFAAFRTQLFAVADTSEHVVITAHMSPDDDSIGSVLSVYEILTAKYPAKDIQIIYTGPAVDRYDCFHNYDKITFVPDIATETANADLLIVCDVSQFARFAPNPEALRHIPNTVVIDHHASRPDEFTLALVVSTFSSNCELIYHAFDEGNPLTKSLAESLLLGILGDTGNFAYIAPSQSGVFLVAKKLLEAVGVSIDSFRSRYGGIPKRIIPLLQELVKNTTYQSVPGWPDAQYSFIDRATVAHGNYSDEDMSGASHIYMGQYLPRIHGYDWGLVLTPRADGGVRMSGRSLGGSVNVRDMFERMGVGGGHDRASGAAFKRETVDREPKQCIVEVLTWMSNNAPLLK